MEGTMGLARKSSRAWMWSVLTALAGAGCATVQASTDYDRNVNFAQFRTFKMLEGRALPSESGAPPNTIVGDRIKRDIQAELMSKGLVPTDTNPDLLVGFVAGARTQQELEAVGPYDPLMGPYMGPGYWGSADVWTTEYQHGTLIIDLVDNSTKKMVWRSRVTADRDKMSELGDPQTIEKAVDKAFKNFPPGSH
jgi:hypothetical protein